MDAHPAVGSFPGKNCRQQVAVFAEQKPSPLSEFLCASKILKRRGRREIPRRTRGKPAQGTKGAPHLHYMLIDNPDILKAESFPSYFRDFRRMLGSTSINVQRGQIDSGDIIEPGNR